MKNSFGGGSNGILSCRSAPVRQEHEIHRAQYEQKGYQVVPAELLFKEEDGKEEENDEGNNLLDSFQLKGREAFQSAETIIGRDHEKILEKGNGSTDKDKFKERHVGAVFLQVSVPGIGHKTVGGQQVKYGTHRNGMVRDIEYTFCLQQSKAHMVYAKI